MPLFLVMAGRTVGLDRKLLARSGSLRGFMAASVLLAGLAGLGAVAQALALSGAISAAFIGGQTLGQLAPWLLLLAAALLGRAALLWANETVAARAAGRAKQNLREPLFARLLALGPAYTRGERSGELGNLATEGVEALDAYFSQYLPQVFMTALVPLVVLAATFATDLLSGVVLALTAPLLPVFMILIGKMADALSRKQWRTMSVLSAHFLDVLQGLPTLRLYNRGKAQLDSIAKVGAQYRDATLAVLRVAFLSALVLEIGATISTAIIAVEIGLRLLYAQIEFGPALFVLLLAPEFYAPFRALGARFHAAMAGGAAADRIIAILDLPLPPPPARPAPLPQKVATISFAEVSFSYGAAEERRGGLDQASFTLAPGEMLALVGPSGAGKSTVASLLLRFIAPDSGAILVDGVPLERIPPAEWRRNVAWVPQHPHLFNTTVLDNIRLGKRDATLAEVEAAAREAQAHDFISALPQGYNTVIGEHGARLSGGEGQRIGLARAFLRDAPLLILDEATSQLDPENEAQIMAAVARRKGRSGILLIAHRLASVAHADRIVTLDAGRVVAAGLHDELLGQAGLYSQLVAAGEVNR